MANTHFTDVVNNRTLDKSFDYTDNNNLLKQYSQGNYQLNYDYYDDNSIKNDTLQYSDDSSIVAVNDYSYTAEGKPGTLKTDINNESLLNFRYSYDLANRVDTLYVNDTLFNKLAKLDKANNIESIQYVKGTDSNPTYQESYEFDGSGNIKRKSTSEGDTSYTYDGNNQLKIEMLPDGTTNRYDYDAVGNRVTAKVNGKEYTFSYNDGNQIKTKNGVNYQYDQDGNLIQDEHYQYEYNALGQQTKVTTLSGDVVAKYEYDENGLRTKKFIGTKTIEYYYENNNIALEVVRENNKITQYRYYRWDSGGITPLGMVIRDQDSSGEWINQPYFFWTNYRGDVVSIQDQSGNEVGSYQYDAFGNILSETGTIAKDNPIRYAGYYYDLETKNYYLKARYYNPENGSFLALDPQPGDDSDPISQNGYTYANNNPVMLVDPEGTNALTTELKVILGLVIGGSAISFNYTLQLERKLSRSISEATDKIKDRFNRKFVLDKSGRNHIRGGHILPWAKGNGKSHFSKNWSQNFIYSSAYKIANSRLLNLYQDYLYIGTHYFYKLAPVIQGDTAIIMKVVVDIHLFRIVTAYPVYTLHI